MRKKEVLNIAYFSPLPPTPSGQSEYSQDLLLHLAKYVDITCYSSLPTTHYPLTAFPSNRFTHHIPVYHHGNSHHHNEIFATFERYPGIVVLHDPVLRDFIEITQHPSRELIYTLGGKEGLDKWLGSHHTVPLIDRILDLALGIVVHSEYAATLIRKRRPDINLAVIPMPMPIPSDQPSAISNQPFVFGFIGQVTANKDLDVALQAFSDAFNGDRNTEFWIIGDDMGKRDLYTAKFPQNIKNQIKWYGYIEDFAEFQAKIAQIHVVLGLRFPTLGETSAALLRALAQGKPAIVYPNGSYDELPDTVVFKTDNVKDAMLDAKNNYAKIAPNTIPYVRANHDPDKSAQAYVRFIQATLDRIDSKFRT